MLLWDITVDAKFVGDNRRSVFPIETRGDKFGNTHYIFNREIFHNPKYVIPDDDLELFRKFLEGGSREYPSDGKIPVDISSNEAKIILEKLKEIASTHAHEFHESAAKLLNGRDAVDLVRGANRLYLSELTTRDWRRKRSTDDIDFWIPNISLLEHVLANFGWSYNKNTREWEKKVSWKDKWTGVEKSNILLVSNDMLQNIDFGSGSHLEGSSIKAILKKKLRRGFDVDLSDVINVALGENVPETDDPNAPWAAFIECSNMRNPKVTSNIISLCRYSYGIAYYLKRVGVSINLYKESFKDETLFTDEQVVKICKVSSHWLKEYVYHPELSRKRIYDNLLVHQSRKLQHSRHLYDFTARVLDLLNSKYEHANIVFEIGFF